MVQKKCLQNYCLRTDDTIDSEIMILNLMKSKKLLFSTNNADSGIKN